MKNNSTYIIINLKEDMSWPEGKKMLSFGRGGVLLHGFVGFKKSEKQIKRTLVLIWLTISLAWPFSPHSVLCDDVMV